MTKICFTLTNWSLSFHQAIWMNTKYQFSTKKVQMTIISFKANWQRIQRPRSYFGQHPARQRSQTRSKAQVSRAKRLSCYVDLPLQSTFTYAPTTSHNRCRLISTLIVQNIVLTTHHPLQYYHYHRWSAQTSRIIDTLFWKQQCQNLCITTKLFNSYKLE